MRTMKRWLVAIMLGMTLALAACGDAGEVEGVDEEQVLPGGGELEGED